MSPSTDFESSVTIGLNAVIVAVTDDTPRVLTVKGADHSLATGEELDALPFGPLDPSRGSTLEKELRRWVKEQTGLDLGYVEQLYTFGDRNRDPRERKGGPRVVSVAYLALVRERGASIIGKAQWRDYYAFLPWEDWRNGCPEIIHAEIVPVLLKWADAIPRPSLKTLRRERIAICFGVKGAAWDTERVLERYELLYEAGLVAEAHRDRIQGPGAGGRDGWKPGTLAPGSAMALDHRRMAATALGRLRGKIKYRPVVFEIIAPTFTLLQLQRVVEALAGVRLHKQNFRRLVDRGGLVEGTGQLETETGGRPAELFRFRREVLLERRAPGVGLPGG